MTHAIEAIAGIVLITFIGVVWVALLLAADSDRHETEFFDLDDHRWANTAPANSRNLSNSVNASKRDGAL